MKKRTLFTLIFAVILVIVSGFSSISLFSQLVKEKEVNTVKKAYKYDKSEELDITINGAVALDLSSSDDDSVHLIKESSTYQTKESNNTDWSIKKKDNQTNITITDQANEYTSRFPFFGPSEFLDNQLFLSIPENYKKITINGSSVDINAYDINQKNIAFKTDSGRVSIYGAVVDNLTINNTSGTTYLSETTINNNVSIESTSGSIDINETTFTNLTAKINSSQFSSDSTTGEMTVTNKNGRITVNENKGKTTLTNENGDIDYSAYKTYADVVLSSQLGVIQIGLNESTFEKEKVELTTQLGHLSIFDEDFDSKNTYSKSSGSNSIKATSKNGDIIIYEIDDDDNMMYEYE